MKCRSHMGTPNPDCRVCRCEPTALDYEQEVAALTRELAAAKAEHEACHRLLVACVQREGDRFDTCDRLRALLREWRQDELETDDQFLDLIRRTDTALEETCP